jgi:LmbE family N-acetylglucosaminyl deacetylase
VTPTQAVAPPAESPKGMPERPGVTLLVLAHHDDEVFCAGHLLRAVATGSRLRILWATAGGLAPARRRHAEGAQVCRLLGLASHSARDLRLPDQAAVFHVAEIAKAAETLLDPPTLGAAGSPSVFVPAYEGGHPDHDAVNLAVALMRSRRPDVAAFEIPLYRRGPAGLSVQSAQPAAWTPPEPFTVLTLDDAALALRRRLAGANASQLLPSLLPLLALARIAGRGRAEPARALPAHDYARPPHGGALLYELYTRRRFAGFRAAALPLPTPRGAIPCEPRRYEHPSQKEAR